MSFAGDLKRLTRDIAGFAGRRGVVAAGLVTLGAVLEGVSLALIVPLLGIVTGQMESLAQLDTAANAVFVRFEMETPSARLAMLLALFGVVVLVRAAVLYLRDMTVADLQSGFLEAQRLRIGARLAAAPWEQLTRLRYARVTHVLNNDILRVGAATNFLLQSAVSLAMLLAQCVLAFILAPALAAWTVAVLALAAFLAVPLMRRAQGLGGDFSRSQLSVLDTATQFLGGLKLAMSQNLQGSFVAEFRDSLRLLRRRQLAFVRQQATGRLALSTLAAFAGGLLVLIGFSYFQVPPATLIVLLLVIARMSGPAGRLLQGMQNIANSLPSYRNVKDLERELAGAASGVAPVPGTTPPLTEGPIAFEAVSYLHAGVDGDAPQGRGIRAVSLVIGPGEIVGISGASGVGKTTFADLLVGLISPQQGRITVAGTVLEGAARAAWRERISYVSQDPFLFHDTVRRNLAWTGPGTDEAQMWEALRLVGADDLVRRMEHGLDTIVGERGALVSGGERQRLALVRAILRRPRLLVMDEATSAIDVDGERTILERLRSLSPRPTMIVIAHRAESLAMCDRVVRFEADGHSLPQHAPPAPARPPLRTVE